MNAKFHTTCTAEKAASAESLLEMNALRVQKAARKRRIEALRRRLALELSVRARRVAEGMHTGDAEAVNEKLAKPAKQLSASVTELEEEAMNGKETAADHHEKSNDVKKRG